MEFYASCRPRNTSAKFSFNSQRDGILQKLVAKSKIPLPCFNSQRDGILQSVFQKQGCFEIVSIPNGMEFYIKMAISYLTGIPFQFPTGWNSTNKTLKSLLSLQVSIPNGMEFYQSSAHLWLARSVSIPNGMEFYLLTQEFTPRIGKFQFPTEWNSTLYRWFMFHL